VKQGEHRILERPERSLVSAFNTSCSHQTKAYDADEPPLSPLAGTAMDLAVENVRGDAIPGIVLREQKPNTDPVTS
jgi:hypothetical protein